MGGQIRIGAVAPIFAFGAAVLMRQKERASLAISKPKGGSVQTTTRLTLCVSHCLVRRALLIAAHLATAEVYCNPRMGVVWLL